jgi:hypothetical protein
MLLRLGLETEEMLPGPVRPGVEQLAGVLRRLQFSARQAEDADSGAETADPDR